jgi:hypothetical protein
VNASSLFMGSTKIKNSNRYMIPKFNENREAKLSLGWIKYVEITVLSNNRVGKLKFFHIIPSKQ